ncbi:hypothetical protein M8J77_004998 [Diaphorina citri]|nr:hypothetical protein M8J77_002658 [Diaphorina citri]KAI5720321.1 hypothetical protein M8J77_004998 [Diaphorina citri]
MRQYQNETAEAFAERFNALRNSVHKRIRLEYPTSDGTLKAALEKVLVTSFLYEVQGPIGQYLRTRQPETFIEINIEIANYSTLYRFDHTKSTPQSGSRTNPHNPNSGFKPKNPPNTTAQVQKHPTRPYDNYHNSNNFNKGGTPFPRNPNWNPNFQQNRPKPPAPTPMSGVQSIKQHHNIESEQPESSPYDYQHPEEYYEDESYEQQEEEYHSDDENFQSKPPDDVKN